jgi:hypothetical protein
MSAIFRFAARLTSLRCHPVLAIVICGVLGIILPEAYAWCTVVPEPRIHDEFSYLLAADTFAHGRLTNPTPDLPEFFEAEHILVVPTYMSKYPPGQGVFLAIGQVVFGHPVFGVWLGCGAFAASLCWMLQGWTTTRWALALTLSFILIHLASYWSQSYWGGMVAACGGALLVGGLTRTLRCPRLTSSLLMGLGVVLLANSRPFEGLLACLPVGAAIAWWLIADRRTPLQKKLALWLFPVSAVCLAGGAAMALQNQAVTGDWRELPYALHQRQYFSGGLSRFSGSWAASRTPCERIARYYNPPHKQNMNAPNAATDADEPPPATSRLQAQTAVRPAPTFAGRVKACVTFAFSGNAYQPSLGSAAACVLISVVALIAGWKSKWARFCWATIGIYLLGAATVWAWFPHYAAPVIPLLYGAAAIALRRTRAARLPWLPHRLIHPALPVAIALAASALSYGDILANQIAKKFSEQSQMVAGSTPRSSVYRYLEDRSGAHLVFVRYSEDYTVQDEWVYNPADLESASILFVHDLGAEKNRQLIERHADRFVWLATVTTEDKSLVPYDE